jgi:hypothetical protein
MVEVKVVGHALVRRASAPQVEIRLNHYLFADGRERWTPVGEGVYLVDRIVVDAPMFDTPAVEILQPPRPSEREIRRIQSHECEPC